jgi:hypothetical protein
VAGDVISKMAQVNKFAANAIIWGHETKSPSRKAATAIITGVHAGREPATML